MTRDEINNNVCGKMTHSNVEHNNKKVHFAPPLNFEEKINKAATKPNTTFITSDMIFYCGKMGRVGSSKFKKFSIRYLRFLYSF